VIRANRQDVAALAGVSTAVVSYVVNGGPRPVAEATRERVLKAMDQLNYRPNASARALKLSKTYVLGLMMWDITNPYYSEFARIFQDLAYQAGYATMVANTGQDGAKETPELESLLAREVDGIATYGIRKEETLKLLASSGVRTVSMNWHLGEQETPTVATDYNGATMMAIDHLRWHGHTRIGFIGGFDDPTQRESTWRAALEATFGEDLDQFAEWGEFSSEGGYHAAMRLLARPDHPTAVFVSSDVQAIGALRAAQVLGLNVPSDIAMVAFDGTTASAFTAPPLTSVQVPFEVTARQCLRKLTDPAGTFERHTTIPHRLVLRESCGCHSSEAG